MPENVAALPFTFEVEWSGDAATLKCHGRLVAGVTDGLYEGLKPLLGVAKRVVVDLEDVAYVDSTGWGCWCGCTSQHAERSASYG